MDYAKWLQRRSSAGPASQDCNVEAIWHKSWHPSRYRLEILFGGVKTFQALAGIIRRFDIAVLEGVKIWPTAFRCSHSVDTLFQPFLRALRLPK